MRRHGGNVSRLIERITAGFARDQAHAREHTIGASELPRAYNTITPQWLTGVVCAHAPTWTVKDYRLEHVEQCSSNGQRVYLEYSQANGGGQPPNVLFCKAAHDLNSRIVLGVTGGGRVEAIFYNTIRPLLEIEAPKAIFARYDPETFNSLIILPDLSMDGSRFCGHLASGKRALVEAQLCLLAEVHGRCYGDPQLRSYLTALPTWPALFQSLALLNIKSASLKGFLRAKDVVPPRIYRRAESIWAAAIASVDWHRNLPATLIHGDVHLKNWYITNRGAVGLSDWETASRGHWSRDVAYIMSTALSVDNRRAWELDLLNFYLDRLRCSGGPLVSLDEAWTHYRQQQLAALVWWSLAVAAEPHPEALEPGSPPLEFFRRTVIAVDDLESLAIL